MISTEESVALQRANKEIVKLRVENDFLRSALIDAIDCVGGLSRCADCSHRDSCHAACSAINEIMVW